PSDAGSHHSLTNRNAQRQRLDLGQAVVHSKPAELVIAPRLLASIKPLLPSR
ncbi:MAG: hypothetical protein RL109_1746, partial [Pseudomonadota bacterium]